MDGLEFEVEQFDQLTKPLNFKAKSLQYTY